MKNLTLSKLALALSLSLLAGGTIAGPNHGHEDKKHQVVKVIAETEKGVEVFVKNNGEKKSYSFDFDELQNSDNVEAKLGDLDETTKNKIVDLLSKLNQHDAAHVVLKDAEFSKGEHETEVFVVKTSNGDDNMHIEIDVEGDGANSKRIERIIAMGDKGKHKGHDKRKFSKKQLTKGLKHLMANDKLSAEDIAELRAILDGAQ